MPSQPTNPAGLAPEARAPSTADWAPDFYTTVYEGYERPESFRDDAALAAYREHLLRKTREQVDFIERRVGRRPLRVLELCSGNGRLLVALAKRGLLEEGLGIEISASRSAFAKRWVEDAGLKNVHIAHGDVLSFDTFARGRFDLAVCITGAFGYFRPIRQDAPDALLALAKAALRPGGHALIELYQLPEERRALLALSDNRLKTWQPLPPEDPFAYYLDDFQYWPDRRTLRHEKIFIRRDGAIDTGRYEVLSYYTLGELKRLLEGHGLRDATAFATFTEDAYVEGRSAALVALARSEDR